MSQISDLSSEPTEKSTDPDLEDAKYEPDVITEDKLSRKLSQRHMSMISIAGVIGTGLFLGTGKSLVVGGPASMLINYFIIGALVYLNMLGLGEMMTVYPIAGSFMSLGARFVDDAWGFSISWNYFISDCISLASDLTACQIIFSYWTDFYPWVIGLIFWFAALGSNIITVRLFGEIEYWLALLKVMSIAIFFFMGILFNVGVNNAQGYLGFHYWHIGDAPFVGGIGGFASTFVSAAYTFGGTESLGLLSGESKNPKRAIPRVTRTIFWRILILYCISVLLIGVNIPYTYLGLSTESGATSPFTIVYQQIAGRGAGSFMNAVFASSIVSGSNHTVYGASRTLYTMTLRGYAPKFFMRLSRNGVPYLAVLLAWICGGLCFGSTFIGAGILFTWLQAIVGVAIQLSWITIAVTCIRFRAGIKAQGKEHLITYKNWTHPWGTWALLVITIFIMLIQGWAAFKKPFDVSAFFQDYLELMVFPSLYIGWKLWTGCRFKRASEMDLDTDVYYETEEEKELNAYTDSLKGKAKAWHIFRSYFI